MQGLGQGGGGEGVLPYIGYMGMCRPHRLGLLLRFGLRTGIHFAHFGLESGVIFDMGEPRDCMNVFIVSIPTE